MSHKKVLSVDFDGVIHSYVSGWHGKVNIMDPPVDGALEWLAWTVLGKEYEVAIFSTRSESCFARKAMKRWLRYWYVKEINLLVDTLDYKSLHCSWASAILEGDDSFYFAGDDPTPSVNKFLKRISFPKHKPLAYLTIDDRCVRFNGNFGSLNAQILNFKQWQRK